MNSVDSCIFQIVKAYELGVLFSTLQLFFLTAC